MSAVATNKPHRAIVGQLTDTTTVQNNQLGMKVFDELGNEYTYVKAGAAIAQYDAVRFNGSALGYDDVRSTSAANQLPLGAAQVAIASGSYGWVMSRGIGTCKVVVSTAAGSTLVTNGTAGTLALSDATALSYRPAVALVTGVAAGSGVALL